MKKLKYILILLFLVSFFDITPFSYAKFHAVKFVEGSITVPENNYCFNNGIDTLSDCMLVMDSYSKNATEAKTAIKAKGTPDFSKTAPILTYEKGEWIDYSKTYNFTNFTYVADSFSFNTSNGLFSLDNPIQISVGDAISSNVGKYSCVTNGTSCNNLYLIGSENMTETNYSITTSKRITFKEVQDINSDKGLYFSNDDFGDSYYYRGNVTNNYVLFANKYWRIVRRNGDDSVRLVYYNDSDITFGEGAYSISFNKKFWDPTYLGFMYNDTDFSATEIISPETTYTDTSSIANISFSKGYSVNDSNIFVLDDSSLIQGSLEEKHNEFLPYQEDGQTKYYYTCFSGKTCPVLFRITGYGGGKNVNGNYISFSSTSYDNAVKNVSKSNLMLSLEDWYKTNISNSNDTSNISYADYISTNSSFCNDRSLSSSSPGDGFNLAPSTGYSANTRLYNKRAPQFSCPRTSDLFSLKTSTVGNKTMDYPIGILTADELIFAGAHPSKYNRSFYLSYQDGKSVSTMTPSIFNASNKGASLFFMYPAGNMGSHWSSVNLSIRPVINLKSTVKLTGGDGTAENPFTVSLE